MEKLCVMNYVLFCFVFWLYEKYRQSYSRWKVQFFANRSVCTDCVEGHAYPTLGERGSDLSSYNISANTDLQSGLVGFSEEVRLPGRRRGVYLLHCMAAVPCPASASIMAQSGVSNVSNGE